MRRWMLTIGLLAVMLSMPGCSEEAEPTGESAVTEAPGMPRVEIVSVEADLPDQYGWYVVKEGVTTMTIRAEVRHADTVLFWAAPTGTDAWAERTLIGCDLDGSDGWSAEWEFGDRSMHDHIQVQALGEDFVSQDNETINVTMDTP